MGLGSRKAWFAISLTLGLWANASPSSAKVAPTTPADPAVQVHACLARGDRAGALKSLETASL